MKNLKAILLLAFLLMGLMKGFSQQGPDGTRISPEEIKKLIGKWEGSLTYIDYSSGEPYTMPADLNIEACKNEYELDLYQIYPDEPKANSKAKIRISKDGKMIDGHRIVSKTQLEGNSTEYLVEYNGKDGNDNKKATIRLTYIFGETTFINRKEVRFLDSDNWIMRNEYSYKKSS